MKALLVASLAEAWIETPNFAADAVARPVASLAEAWIETRWNRSLLLTGWRRLPRGGVD